MTDILAFCDLAQIYNVQDKGEEVVAGFKDAQETGDTLSVATEIAVPVVFRHAIWRRPARFSS